MSHSVDLRVEERNKPRVMKEDFREFVWKDGRICAPIASLEYPLIV